MKKLLLAAVAAALALPLSAAPSVEGALKAYVLKALQKCPDSSVTLQQIEQPGPTGFVVYAATLASSDKNCGKQTYVLYSPMTQQIVMGYVFALSPDARPVNVRAAEKASDVLKQPIRATIGQMPLPDGLHTLALTKDTQFGPFSYHGFIDSSERFMIVGTRGNLSVDPGKTLLESLDLRNAVRRGNPKAKVQIVELSDFECPTCGRAHKKVEPMMAKNLSKVDYYRLDLPLFETHEWSLLAAMGARAIQKIAPAKYWSYVNFVFENQETIGKQNFDTVLKNFCEDHDINWPAVEKLYRSPAERTALLDQVSRAFDNGINSTPTYIINGQMIGYGPEGKFTIEQLEKAIGVK